ncbi:MAG: response regulator transcription factor [Polaromonas sp.]|nr:response regulator transcription factor [Polaromonas sp.]
MRILIVDDHALFRAGIALLLLRLDAAVALVEVSSVEEALVLAETRPPGFELVLQDLNLHGTQGLDALRTMQQAFPGAALVVVSGRESSEAMREARAKGARGYIVKSMSADAMLAALQKVLAGASHFPLLADADPHETRLTPRQRDILKLLCQGLANKEIALQLGMSNNTVRTHLMFAFRVLGVRSRTAAALAARRLGFI